MLRRLAKWSGWRIAALWVVLVVVESIFIVATRVSDDDPLSGSLATRVFARPTAEAMTQIDRHLQSRADTPAPANDRRRHRESRPAGGLEVLVDSAAAPLWQAFFGTALSPTFILFLAAMAVAIYGPPLGLTVLTILWIVARTRYGMPAGTA